MLIIQKRVSRDQQLLETVAARTKYITKLRKRIAFLTSAFCLKNYDSTLFKDIFLKFKDVSTYIKDNFLKFKNVSTKFQDIFLKFKDVSTYFKDIFLIFNDIST